MPSAMVRFVFLVMLLTLSACDHSETAVTRISPESARYEAQKILSALKGRAGSAAFMDVVLKRDDAYAEIFTNGLKPLIAAAPVAKPEFSIYLNCVESGKALLKFAELRKLGGGQNAQSDEYRRPYWDNLSLCEKAIG